MKVIGFVWIPPKRATSSASNSFRLRSRAGFLPDRKRQGPKSSRATGSSFVFLLRRFREQGGQDFIGCGKRQFVVIPSRARDLLFATDKGKSRFLAPFKKRTGLGMTIRGISGGSFRLCWQCPFHRQDARQRRARRDCPHTAIAAAGRRCAPARPGSGTS